MREIKFRGKRIEDGKWVYGNYYKKPSGNVYIYNNQTLSHYRVYPATIGQYTGLNEKLLRTGKEIYEDDLVEANTIGINYRSEWVKGVVKFLDGCFEVEFCEPIYDVSIKTYRTRLYLKCFVVNNAIKVIGKIYDNPELLDLEGACT